MIVLFVNSTRKWGGVKTWTLDYGRALAERGHRVVAAIRPGTPFEDACREAGFVVRPFRFGPKYNPVAIARMTRLVRNHRPDVAVVNISKDLEIGAVAARLCGVGVVHRVGLVEDYRGTWEERLRQRWLVDRVLVPSSVMRDRLAARFPWLSAEEVFALPNAKFLARYRPGEHRTGTDVVFGTASQFNPSKGHAILLEAVERLVRGGERIRLRLAGTGPLEGELRAKTDSMGLAGVVEFCGFLEDMPSFLASLDAYVLPSLKEGFPNSLLEALCAGLPTVATRLEGVEEMVGDAGLICARGDADALARAMDRVAADADLRRRLGGAARARAQERYDVRKNVLALEAFLGEVARA